MRISQAYSFAANADRKKMLGGKAMELYDKVLAANPNNLDAKTNLGMAYMSSDNPVKGIALLREVLEKDPKNEKVLYTWVSWRCRVTSWIKPLSALASWYK